jgi:hypothetical protein
MKTMMMNSSRDFFLDDPWSLIKHPCYPEGRRLYLNDERFWVAMDKSHHLLFFVQGTGADKIKPLENLEGLVVSLEECGGDEHRLVCRLTSHESELLDKFATVAKDIAFHCSQYKGSQLFIKTQERIKSWANFLKPSRIGLTQSEFIGIFGELYVLSEQLMLAIPPDEAVRAWVGPEGKKQDFTFNDSAIEVKTTFSGDKKTIRISSLDQLDKVTSKLYLMHVVASPSNDGAGLCLSSLYGRCVEAVSHNIRAESMFLQKCAPMYGKASESQLRDCYVIISVKTYGVVEGFPKLTRSDVDLAITDLRYDIALGALSNFEATTDIREIAKYG